ncbi:MAG: AMP-dependent synthetase and ligase [Bryobacterales bacterium]|nr:AMP-dependent synthetase and ligase [Bryobacterales bacterium]
MSQKSQAPASYLTLLANGRFEAFLWTQFLGAFNDNLYKMIVSLMAIRVASQAGGGKYLALAGAVFVLPFLLFAGYAGQLADWYSKTRVLQVTKSLEIVTMLIGIGALVSGRSEFLLVVLFLLATQANFFSPAKYGILPEVMDEREISRANGLLELTTFIAIVIGTSFGTFLYSTWKDAPVLMGTTLLAIALIGSGCSLFIAKVPAAGSREPFHLNPFHEIIAGSRELAKDRLQGLSVIGISWFWFVGALIQLALLLDGKEELGLGDNGIGILVTALALGIGAGSIAAGTISGNRLDPGISPVGGLLMGISTVALGLSHTYQSTMIWLVVTGFAGGLFVVPLNAWLQEKAPATEKGRVMATNNFANMVGVILASAALWLFHDRLHFRASSIMAGVGVVMAVSSIWIARELALYTTLFVLRCLAFVAFDVRIEGEDHIPRKGGGLLAANHISYADSIFVGLCSPRVIRFVMWKPIYDIPVAKQIFQWLLAIPIDASSPKAVIRALRAARVELEAGHLVAMFPEGSITRDGTLQKFERGIERIAVSTLPIIPIHIEGMWGHPLSCKGGALLKSWEKLWRPRITVRVGPPLSGEATPEELREAVERLAQ